MKPALEKLGLKVYMEPGRSISANAGVLQVGYPSKLHIKQGELNHSLLHQ
jgi:diaminopimelate decarboxylase